MFGIRVSEHVICDGYFSPLSVKFRSQYYGDYLRALSVQLNSQYYGDYLSAFLIDFSVLW